MSKSSRVHTGWAMYRLIDGAMVQVSEVVSRDEAERLIGFDSFMLSYMESEDISPDEFYLRPVTEFIEYNEEQVEQATAMLGEMQALFDEGADYVSALFPDREYDGQAHTDSGTRGRQEVSGVSFRDVADSFIIGAFEASGLQPAEYPKTIFDLPWGSMDPKAVSQEQVCALEKRMGIYPNAPLLRAEEEKPAAEVRNQRLVSAMEKMHQLVEAMDLPDDSKEALLREEIRSVFWKGR